MKYLAKSAFQNKKACDSGPSTDSTPPTFIIKKIGHLYCIFQHLTLLREILNWEQKI